MGRMVSVIDTVAAVAGLGVVSPTREEFHQLAADRRVIPVVRRVLADAETPVGVYRKLAQGRPNTFLLESAENGRSWSRWSFVGVNSPAVLTERDGAAHWTGTRPAGLPAEGDPLDVAARDRADACTPTRCPACPRSPAAWSASSATTRSAASSGCPTSPRTTSSCPSSPCCWPPTSPPWTTTRAPSRSSPTP